MPRPELPAVAGIISADQVAATAASIVATQERSGAIPWFPGGHTDPWDHVECAMALSAAGEFEAAVRAYRWLAATVRRDGSWPSKVRGSTVEDPNAESNHAAYLAVGVWHHWQVSGDERFVHEFWPTVRRGVDFVVGMQTARGEVLWSRSPEGDVVPEALLTGCSSIHQSLRCAAALSRVVGSEQPDWELAAGLLAHAVADHPEAFLDKSRFSMDWYYPVLGGVLRHAAGRRRLAERWAEFVVPGFGARCVADQPWVTGAETCELVMALDTVGEGDPARALLADMQHLRERDGSYWTGLVLTDQVRWPAERSTWTAAAVILATDALSGATGGSGVFRAENLPVPLRLGGSACACVAAGSSPA